MAIPLDAELIKEIMTHLPFDLTGGQKIALFQLLKDMEKPHAMQRLMEGDVGTGKTIVALIAAIHGIKVSERNTSPQPSPLRGEGEAARGTHKSPGYVFQLAQDFRKHPTNTESTLWEVLRNRGFL